MYSYLFPIKWAFITFPIAALIIWLPFLIFHYRKYGYVNLFRSLVLYSLLLYVMTAYYLVILPLPETTDTCSRLSADVRFMQLVPFQFVTDFLKETSLQWNNPSTYMGVITERGFLQAAFNFLLFIPFGVYLRYYFRRSWKVTLLLSFCGSLFFELTQLSGLYGIYNCPYRVFDVDDLLLNTSGGMAGYIITPYITRMLPNAAQLDKHIDLAAKRVSYIRRGLAWAIDWFLLSIAAVVLRLDTSVAFLGLVLLYFILFPYVTRSGQTIGKKVVRIRVAGEQGRATFKELAIRYSLLYLGLFLPLMIAQELLDRIPLVGAMMLMCAGLLMLAFAIHVVIQVLRRKRLFYEKVSGTSNVIAFEDLVPASDERIEEQMPKADEPEEER